MDDKKENIVIKKTYKSREIDDIQNAINQMVKKVEHSKIGLGIANERYDKKYANYCELQGKDNAIVKEKNKNKKKVTNTNKQK